MNSATQQKCNGKGKWKWNAANEIGVERNRNGNFFATVDVFVHMYINARFYTVLHLSDRSAIPREPPEGSPGSSRKQFMVAAADS